MFAYVSKVTVALLCLRGVICQFNARDCSITLYNDETVSILLIKLRIEIEALINTLHNTITVQKRVTNMDAN